VRQEGAEIEITVADTGQGIAPEFLQHVFEQFRQADASATRTHGGLGLGLSIAKHFVEAHGGTVAAASEGEGKGATFVVRLPLAAEGGTTDPEPATARRAVNAIECPPSLTGARVLVVDDEPDTLEMLTVVLGDCDAEVRSAHSADEALAVLDGWRPDVIVSDVAMPGADGYELIRRIRARPRELGGAIPAVALTAYARVENRMTALQAGFQMHVAKPVEPAELVNVVHRLLEFKGTVESSGDRGESGEGES
jgi:CheY-like chemotaxis protein